MFIRSAKLLIPLLCIVSFHPFLLSAQNHKPVAVRDTASVMAENYISVDVLHNDYDPDGDPISLYIWSIPKHGHIMKVNDSTLQYNSYYYTGIDSLYYSIKDQSGNISDKGYLVLNVLPNPSLPHANNEYASVLASDSLVINLTKNDIDPDGDSLMIITYPSWTFHTQVLTTLNDSMVLYRSDADYTGLDSIKYKVIKKHNPLYYSNYAYAVINVQHNPDLPVAVNDTVDYRSYTHAHFYPMQNDLNPSLADLEVMFPIAHPPFITVNDDQSLVLYDSVWNIESFQKVSYYVRDKSDTARYSNTASLVIHYSHNPQFFYAYDDNLSVDAWDVLIHDVVANDYNPDPYDTLNITFHSTPHLSDSIRFTGHIMKYYPDNRFSGIDSLFYEIESTSHMMKLSQGKVMIKLNNKNEEYLDINNVRALFHSSGLHFFREHAEYEVPKGSGKTSLFSNSLWIGGKDGFDSLHFAGEKYRQWVYSQAWTYPDYYSGPVMDPTAYGHEQDSAWSYVWKLNRTEIEYHRNHYYDQGYQPIKDILTWPGNGNVSLGQSAKLAPYVDSNADGIYNPMDGDYPEIRGDQSLFFIFNDDRGFHNESLGKKLKVEIQGLAYAFDRPNDTAFKNTVFLHYTVINRSDETYSGTYFGVFTDIDLGYSGDDYIGCDVERNAFYGHNGDTTDGTGQTQAYGSHPPVQAVMILSGPKMDDDGIDNPKYDNIGNQLCDESVNGFNFGDSIVDNERYGMRKFVYFNNNVNSVPDYMTDPYVAAQFYNIMRGIWKDSTEMIYGGNGHSGYGGYGPACDFMFPGNSDSLNWGVGCMAPNGPVYWTEKTADNKPGDRRGVASSGPFTFKPGDRQEIDVAFAWARDYTSADPMGSLNKLLGVVDQVNHAFAGNSLPDGTPIYGIDDRKNNQNLEFNIFPNPARDQLALEFGKDEHGLVKIQIISIEGNILKEFRTSGKNRVSMNVSDLPGGVYVVRCQSSQTVGTKKIIIIR